MNIRQKKRYNRRTKDPFLRRAKRAFLKSVKVIAVAAALPALAYGGVWLYRELVTTPYLAVWTITVSGAERVSKEDIIGLSGIRKGQNLLSFSVRTASERIKKNPWIREAAVSRSIPDSVAIEITERQPLVLVKMDDLYIMDSTGVVFKKFSPKEDALDLPVVTGLTKGALRDVANASDGLMGLIAVLKGRRGFNLNNVSEIHMDPTFGLSVYTLPEGVRLDVGTEGFERKLLSFESIVRSRGGSLRGVEAMDLNGGRDVVVSYSVNVLVKEGGDTNGQKG